LFIGVAPENMKGAENLVNELKGKSSNREKLITMTAMNVLFGK
jgi:hypothetical protein